MSSLRCVAIIFFSLAASFVLGVSGEQAAVQRDAVYRPGARPAGGSATVLSPQSGAKVDCATPMIRSCDPAVVTADNCATGCAVSFSVEPLFGAYDRAKTRITLERKLGEIWIPEDSILAPVPGPPWTLTCEFDEHYTDGEHVFRAVLRCEGFGSVDMLSPSVTVAANRGVPAESDTWGRIKGLYED